MPKTSEIFAPNGIVSIIANMKWKIYGIKLYLREFCQLLMIGILLFLDIFWVNYSNINEDTKWEAGICFKTIIMVNLLWFI